MKRFHPTLAEREGKVFSNRSYPMLILNAAEVRQALPMPELIEAMKAAYAALSAGQAEVPVRVQLPVAPHQGTSLFMPAYVQDSNGEALAIKIVSVFPQNTRRNLPVIHAAVLVLDAETGKPVALLEGGSLTALRTGAASGAATDLLARPEARTAAIFGAGVQGRTQLQAICSVRPIETAWIYDLNPAQVQAFIADTAGHGPIPSDLRPATDAAQAVAQADIICTATTSPTPVYLAEAVQPGTHINGVGSYTLSMIENPPEIYSRACAFIDSREAILAEAGETVAAINRKLLFPAELTELGNVVLGKDPGRISAEQITFFKSVGVAVQDAFAARLALENARQLGLGQEVALSD